MDMNPILAANDNPERGAVAFATVRAELAAMPAEAISFVNLDIPRATATAVVHAPAIASHRSEIGAALPQFPMHELDMLETYACAAMFAHTQSLVPREVTVARTLLDEALARRAELRVAADALGQKDIFDPQHVAACRSGPAAIDVATELLALSTLFQQRWGDVAQRTAVSRDDVDRAAVVGHELRVALGGQEPADGAADMRARAFTRFIEAYDACRRALVFLRWREGDADRIAPSLYVRRRARRRASESEAPTAPAAPATPATPATPAAPVVAPNPE